MASAASASSAHDVPDETAAGVIFGCTNATYDECFSLALVGMPNKYLPLVNIIRRKKTLIFLFNYSTRQLHGLYVASTDGGENLFPTAFRGLAPIPPLGRRRSPVPPAGSHPDAPAPDGAGSPFPAQCGFAIVEELPPVPESQIERVLEYTERHRFKFKLSEFQCRDLIEVMVRWDESHPVKPIATDRPDGPTSVGARVARICDECGISTYHITR